MQKENVGLSIYLDRRMIRILLLGAISGFPWVIIGSALSLWLKDFELSRSTIGWAGLIFGVYAINFLWAPLIDRIKIPFLTDKIGHRKSWIISLQIIRGAVAAQNDGYLDKYIYEVLKHMWEEPKKMDDPDVIKEALTESGLDAERLMEQMQDPEIKAQLISNTEEAVNRGTFGIPTFFVGEEIFFGKDTLWQVEELLRD